MRGGRNVIPGRVRARDKKSRFSAFNPDEQHILAALLTEHANTVSSIASGLELPVSEYLVTIERLEKECGEAG